MIDVVYDGNNKFIFKITRVMKRLDRKRRLHFTNFAERKFDARIFEKSSSELKQQIHAVKPDGRWVLGADAIRTVGSALGFGPIILVTQQPLIRQLTNLAYHGMVVACRPASDSNDNRTNSPADSTRTSAA